MNHGSLFTGEGGFDLAAECMGWDNIFHCELNDNLRWFLENRWPKAKSYADIKQTDFTIWRGKLDILTGGFPCQPYSQSGKRLGKEDDRHLWPDMLRAIRESQPAWVVGENVRGLINWNGGLVFDEVQADLEAEGYEVQPFLLPAAGVGAPHERYRIWFVAYSKRFERTKRGGKKAYDRKWKICQQIPINRNEIWNSIGSISKSRFASDSNGRYESRDRIFETIKKRTSSGQNSGINHWRNFPTQSPICSGNDGFYSESLRQLIREDSMGYLSEKEIDKIFSKANIAWRKESLMAGGNAIVPQVVLQIFKAIKKFQSTEAA